MNHKQEIDEQALDELLKELYLEENSHVPNEREADFVMNGEYRVVMDPVKEQALLKQLLAKWARPSRLPWYLLAAAVISLAIALLIYIISQPDTTTAFSHVPADAVVVKAIREHNLSGRGTNQEVPAEHQVIRIRSVDTFGRPHAMALAPNRDSVKLKMTSREIVEQSTPVPYLADKDRMLYQKIKEQMILQLLQSNKDLYTHVPANKMTYAGKALIYDGFTFRNVQITNLEYRTFLADLLAQKREADYLVADVLPEYWINEHCPELSAHYFQSEVYNDFPVVTVSMRGANLFCQWLEEETALYIKQHHLKLKPLKIRLPYDEDWIAAAREGYAKIAFDEGYNTIYDKTENLVDDAFAHRVEIVKKRVKRVDSLYTTFTTNRYGWSEKELLSAFAKGMNAYPGVQADTIYTARMKMLGKIGRVSEIVLQKKSPKVWLAGLSWKNKQDYLKLENEFKANTASPFVGFRIVVIDPDDPDYKSPFW